MAAAIGMIAGCQKPEMVQMSPIEDVVAPVLSEVAAIEITSENMGLESATFTWTAADYGVKTQVNYAIEVSSASHAEKVVVTSGINDTKATVPYEALNAIFLYDLELASGVAEDVQFVVSAKVGESPKVYSAPVTVTVSATAAEKVYPSLTVAGSYAYNNWTPGKGQFVFDFDGADEKYSGIIDFGEDVSALNFKFVGSKWGENEFSVPSGEAQAAEAAELPLVAGGGDNISAYTTHRYYSFTLDKKAPKVIKNFSFNSLGVSGDATTTGWDSDTDMAFNAAKQRFYVDLTLVDGTIKFRANDAWDVNWGGADGVLASGADNIPVTAGNYRIYVNLNNPAEPVYELSAKMYGQPEDTGATEPEEPVEPEEPAAKGWGLVGEYNSWGEQPDVMLASDGTYLAAKGVELSGQVKFRKDGAWDVNFGAPGDVEPVEITVNTELELVAGGKNFTIAEGTYDVYLDEANAKAWFINDGSYPGGGAAPEASEWGIVGQVNGWAAPDITMYKTETEGLFVSYNVAMPDGGFKIRANGEWNDAANYGFETAGTAEVDHVYALICGGGSKDITLAAGTYDIWFDLTNSKVYIMTPGKSITEAEGGEVEVQKLDYTNCQMELVGSGVAEQEGSSADTAWSWGNVLLASNEGKPAKDGDVYTWTWSGVALTADGWKIRTLNAAASGDVPNFDLGDGAVDKTASPNAQASEDGNIYMTAGNYDITLVIDAAADTKTVTVVAAE